MTTAKARTIAESTQREARQAEIDTKLREIGIGFTDNGETGYADYTEERKELYKDVGMEQLLAKISEIEKKRTTSEDQADTLHRLAEQMA